MKQLHLVLLVVLAWSAISTVTHFAAAVLGVPNDISVNGGSGYVGTVTLLSGRPTKVGDNTGTTPINASLAEYISPSSLAGDNVTGSILVADQTTIRNISNGTVWVIAGQRRTSGFSDGPVATAKLAGPTGLRLVTPSTGGGRILYFCDTSNNAIRMIQNGNVTTIAGDIATATLGSDQPGAAGYADGANANARFDKPEDMDVGPDGSLYVADNANNAIRKISNGATSTLFRIDGMIPNAVKSSPTLEYLVVGCVINNIDVILLYFYGNNTYKQIATSPTTTNAFDFDENNNILFAVYSGFYVLYKNRNWERGLIVSGSGYANGEYPSNYIAPLFQGIQAFTRVKGFDYAFAEASPNYVVRSMTIYPELTIVQWRISVKVANIPVWNATVLESVTAAVYADLVRLCGWSRGVSPTPTPVGSGGTAATLPSSPDTTTTSTNFVFDLPVFLNNYSTRMALASYNWPSLSAVVNNYYGNTTFAIYVPIGGMPVGPITSSLPTGQVPSSTPYPVNPLNVTSYIASQWALIEDLKRIIGYDGSSPNVQTLGGFYPVIGSSPTTVTANGTATNGTANGGNTTTSAVTAAFNVSSASTLIMYVTVPGRFNNATTTAALRALIANSSADVSGGTPAYASLAQWVTNFNEGHPLALTFPNPMPTAANGGMWPTTNATVLREAALAALQALRMITAMPATSPSSSPVADFTFVASSANASDVDLILSSSAFSANASAGSITLYGTIRGPLENATTTSLLQQYLSQFSYYGSATNQSSVPTNAAAKAISDVIVNYNKNQTIRIFFDAAAVPFANGTFMGPIIAAFGSDITNYFASSPLGACCVSFDPTNYTIMANGEVAFFATIPGGYYNDTTNFNFANRNLVPTATAPASPFVPTLKAIADAAAPRSVNLWFDLEGFLQPDGSTFTAINFPIANASAMFGPIVGYGLARDIAALVGSQAGLDLLTDITNTTAMAAVATRSVLPGMPSFSVQTPVGGSTSRRYLVVNLTIPCAAYNDTTNAAFAGRSAALATALTAAGGDASSPIVSAELSTAYPHLAAALAEYYATKTLRITFTPAGNLPLYVDPIVTTPPTTTVLIIPTFHYGGNETTNITTTAAPTTSVPPSMVTTTPAPTGDTLTRMGQTYAALYADVMRVIRGNIDYPTSPNAKGYPNVPVGVVREYNPNFEIFYTNISKTVYTNVTVIVNATTNETAVVTVPQTVWTVTPSVVLKLSVPGPFYNDSTLTRLSQPSAFSSVTALVSETRLTAVRFTNIAVWPLYNATRMARIRELLVADACDYFNYTGEYLTLASDIGPDIENATAGTLLTPASDGSITWYFNVPVVAVAVDNVNNKNLSFYNFPKTKAALDSDSSNQETTFIGGAAEPAFFGDSCGKGCVIGIALAAAAGLAVAAVIAVLVVSKRKRRADVVSPNFNPVMNGKIGLDLDD